MKESCLSKVRTSASASQVLLAVLDIYRATVISKLLSHPEVSPLRTEPGNCRGSRNADLTVPTGMHYSLICSQAVIL